MLLHTRYVQYWRPICQITKNTSVLAVTLGCLVVIKLKFILCPIYICVHPLVEQELFTFNRIPVFVVVFLLFDWLLSSYKIKIYLMPNLHLCTFLANSCQRSMLTCIDEPWQAYLRYSSTIENIFINVHGIFKYLKYLPSENWKQNNGYNDCNYISTTTQRQILMKYGVF
jgi:hypothetical protein